MITPEQAYKNVKKVYPVSKLIRCLDFGSFYLFVLGPIGDSEPALIGHIFNSVDKRTGKVFLYDVLSDLDAYERSKIIPVKTEMDMIV